MNSKSLTIYGLNQFICYSEAQGLSICFQAYADNCPGEDIMQIGFNANSGYTYIALENGISICSMLGRPAQYLVTNFENGQEEFFVYYTLALNHLETINA